MGNTRYLRFNLDNFMCIHLYIHVHVYDRCTYNAGIIT